LQKLLFDDAPDGGLFTAAVGSRQLAAAGAQSAANELEGSDLRGNRALHAADDAVVNGAYEL